MSRVVHFEIHVDDPDRAIGFWKDAFGWDFQRFGDEEYWLVRTGADGEPGIDGGLMRRRDPAGSVYTTIGVESVDAAMAKVLEAGGETALEKVPVPGVGWIGYFRDTEGNVHGIFEADTSAGT